jgi:hypothetical protein
VSGREGTYRANTSKIFCFHDESTNDFKATDVIEQEILVNSEQPVRRSQYQTPFSLREEMKAQVENMLDKGIIRPGNSAWSTPALLVTKRSLDGKPKY